MAWHKAWFAAMVLGLMSFSAAVGAQVRDTASQEVTCKEIGFRPKTIAYADCVMELLSRNDSGAQTVTSGTIQARTSGPRRGVPSAPRPQPVALTPHEQTCASYGFKRTTNAFSSCLMELDRAKVQAELAQQQYQFQYQQYQQQVAAYNAQQEAIKRERNRRQGEALMRMSQGMLNSRSPTLLGGLADGFAAVNGAPLPQPVAPLPPSVQNYTVRLPSGNQVYCNYNSLSGYMSCR